MRESRGRSRNSSPSVSSHISCTQGTLVKNRCPPRSKRKPSCSTVFAMPPTWESASNNTPAQPRDPSRCAAVRPAGPPPSTAIPAVVPPPIPLHPSGVLRQHLEEVAECHRRLGGQHRSPDADPVASSVSHGSHHGAPRHANVGAMPLQLMHRPPVAELLSEEPSGAEPCVVLDGRRRGTDEHRAGPGDADAPVPILTG